MMKDVVEMGALIVSLVVSLVLSSALPIHAEQSHPMRVDTAIDTQLEPYAPHIAVQGRMTVAGSDTMQPVLSKLAMEFRRRHPEMKIAVQGSRDSKLTPEDVFLTGIATMRRGDGDPSGHFGAYHVHLLASSRALTAKELERFESRYGYPPIPVPIAQDAVAVYVNKDNPVSQLTLAEVDAIFSKSPRRGHSDIKEWGEVGLDGEWQHMPVRLYGRDQRSTGTLPFFKEVVMQGSDFKKKLTAEPGSASVVVAVGKDIQAIGYSGIGFQTTAVKAVPLSEAKGQVAIAPTVESVMQGQYPLSRPLYLYVNKDPEKQWDPKILEFLRFVNSREGQTTVARAGVYPLTSSQLAQNLALLESKRAHAGLR